MGSDVSDVVQHEPDEHEEEADQGKGRGGADHLWSGEERREGGREKTKEQNPNHDYSYARF